MSELIDRLEFPEVLPCPFCGSKPKIFTMKRKGYVDIHYIECVNRKCNEPYSKAYDEEEVVKKWNTRHYPPEVEKAVERMKPKKVIPEKVYWAPKNRRAYFIRFLCPTCGVIANQATNRTFCNNNGCGQALDWSE